jgi:predicted nucleic acid-binding protein
LIVVDTSVWLDLFRDRGTAQVELLVELLEQDANVGLTDLVLTELLQGAREGRQARRLEWRVGVLDVLRLESLDDYRRAASLYRRSRDAGLTVSKTVDCLIASVCVREHVAILHNDADFDRLAACTELQTVGSSG